MKLAPWMMDLQARWREQRRAWLVSLAEVWDGILPEDRPELLTDDDIRFIETVRSRMLR